MKLPKMMGPVLCGVFLFLSQAVLPQAVMAQQGSTWLQLNPSPDPQYGSPTPRFDHTAVYNPTTNRMVVFGGANLP